MSRISMSMLLVSVLYGAASARSDRRPQPAPPFAIEPGTRSEPNLNGGQTFRLPDGKKIESEPNLDGGFDYRLPDGRKIECRPNLNGGQDCR